MLYLYMICSCTASQKTCVSPLAVAALAMSLTLLVVGILGQLQVIKGLDSPISYILMASGVGVLILGLFLRDKKNSVPSKVEPVSTKKITNEYQKQINMSEEFLSNWCIDVRFSIFQDPESDLLSIEISEENKKPFMRVCNRLDVPKDKLHEQLICFAMLGKDCDCSKIDKTFLDKLCLFLNSRIDHEKNAKKLSFKHLNENDRMTLVIDTKDEADKIAPSQIDTPTTFLLRVLAVAKNYIGF